MRSRSGRIGHIFWFPSRLFARHFDSFGFVRHYVVNRHFDHVQLIMLTAPIHFMLVLHFWIAAASTHHRTGDEKTASFAAHFAHLIVLPERIAAFNASAMDCAMSFVLASCIRFMRCSAGVAARSFVDCSADLAGFVLAFECII